MQLTLCMTTLESELESAEHVIEMALERAGLPAEVIVDSSPAGEGWVKPTNCTIRRALDEGADYIALLQDNFLSFSENWAARLIEVLGQSDTYAVAGPSIPCGTNPQRSGRPRMAPEVRVVDLVCYTCPMFRRGVFDDVGLLDEAFIHYGADYDHLRRAQQQGWQAVYVPDVYIGHEWSALKYPAWKRHDAPIYYQRWQ